MLLQTIADFAWLERCERVRREQLKQIQNRRLKAIVSHAAHRVPFYSKLYELAGVDPDGIDSLSDLRKLPLITKQQFRDVSLIARTAIGTDVKLCLTRTTSGSTGIPITVHEEPSATARRIALWLRRFRAYGVGLGDRVCFVIPGDYNKSYFSAATGLAGFIMEMKFRTLSLAEGLHENAGLISKWKPTVIVGPASYHRALIRFFEEEKQDLSLRVAIAGGEMLDGLTRKLIGERYHTDRVFEIWGATEIGPIAWECPTHSGYHINAESLIVEFLRDGEPAAIGEPGELCVTNLYRKATPMIRYLLGDIATLVDDECPCGRGLPLMKEKLGRLVDYITTRNGTMISPYRVMQMLEEVPGVAQYKVIQDEDGSIEVLVMILKADGIQPDRVLQEIGQNCRQLFAGTPFVVRQVERIDAIGKGKSRVVESHLTKSSSNIVMSRMEPLA